MANSISRYRGTARLIHWGMAILVLMMIPAGFIMVQQELDRSLQNTLFIFHKNFGVLLLVLVVIRLAYRWMRPPPPLPATVPEFQEKIAGLTHVALYALLVIMPIAGYIRVRAGGFPIEFLDAAGIPALVAKSEALANAAKSIHAFGAIAITLLIAMHVGAALYHAIVLRDGVFSRMWPPLGGRTE